MHVKIQASGVGGNSGSCGNYANYLEKENEGKQEKDKEHFFSHTAENIKVFEVINKIDNNKKKLGKDEAKFYSVILSPSESELEHIGNDKDKLKDFTRSAMDEYAKNFNRGIEGKDLVYFAKIENERKYNYKDNEVIRGEAKRGELKKGNQTHIHIIVSRKDKEQRLKLSPLAMSRNSKGKLNGKLVQKGFDRKKYYTNVEKAFDKKLGYTRDVEDTFEYKLEKSKLNFSEKQTFKLSQGLTVPVPSEPKQEQNHSLTPEDSLGGGVKKEEDEENKKGKKQKKRGNGMSF